MTKHLIGLISTEGKTSEQISKQVTEAVQKYEKVKAQVESKQSSFIFADCED